MIENQPANVTNSSSFLKDRFENRNQKGNCLGGLIDDRSSKDDSLIPFIVKVPLIGWLFTSTSESKYKRTLYVLRLHL
ncbi:hypothetical protein [Yersinia frederiksenii]|uniref:hypothetical protein n=1 Tax=Yersinia frederiksenii TaxID=29484 RepID=UPI0009C0B50C